MQTLWFVLVAGMLTMYVLLDGFDLGAGAIHFAAAKTDVERRSILRAIGPVWDGNEVWLIASGGTMFFAFPRLYAASFSGFYLPLIVVLWLLMVRGVAIELRSHVKNPVWWSLWDGAFFLGSALLALLLGVALGNVVRGVPLDAQATFFVPLWTSLSPTDSQPGAIDWYTLLIGFLAVAALIWHGANFVALKTEGAVQERCHSLSAAFWLLAVLLTALATPLTFVVRPAMLASFAARPWGFVFPLLAIAGLAYGRLALARGYDLRTLLSSGAYLAGMLASTAFGLYPDVLPAVDPANSLTVLNASTSRYGMAVGLAWWVVGMALAAFYFIMVYRLFRGKVRVSGAGY